MIDFGRTDLNNYGTITPLNFEGYLIFSLSRDWVNRFSSVPRFSVRINDIGRLIITSESSVKKGERD